jgi:TfoX/Sxy family transcriptional regulator of competence genes
MATTRDFIEYACGQIAGIGNIRYMKMMGEYLAYVDDKPTLLVCDNVVYVKLLPCLNGLMADAEKGTPYHGAKEHYILDIDDADKARAVARLVADNTPFPKRKNEGNG